MRRIFFSLFYLFVPYRRCRESQRCTLCTRLWRRWRGTSGTGQKPSYPCRPAGQYATRCCAGWSERGGLSNLRNRITAYRNEMKKTRGKKKKKKEKKMGSNYFQEQTRTKNKAVFKHTVTCYVHLEKKQTNFYLWFKEFCVLLIWYSRLTGLYVSSNYTLWWMTKASE